MSCGNARDGIRYLPCWLARHGITWPACLAALLLRNLVRFGPSPEPVADRLPETAPSKTGPLASALPDRPGVILRVADSFRVHPAVALIGPRQCGKTTLAQIIAAEEREVESFDLERVRDRRRPDAPEQALAPLSGLVGIDEIQLRQKLFETLRVLLD